MKTFLTNHFDFRKSNTMESKSSFFQTVIRLILKFLIIYTGVMFLGFICYQKMFSWLLNYRYWGVHYYPSYYRTLLMSHYRYSWWQFFKFLFDFSTGKWPESFVIADGVPALELISVKFSRTIELLLYSSILILIGGFLIGFLIVKAKWKRNYRFIDEFFRILVGIFLYIPLIGIFLQYSLAIKLEIFPTLGIKSPGFEDPITITGLRLIDCFLTGQTELFRDTLQHLILPLFTVTSCGIGLILRDFRNSITRIFKRNLPQSTIAKGAKLDRKSLFTPKTSVSLVLKCLQSIFPSIISIIMLTDRVFNLKGIGMLFIDAVNYRDAGVVIGIIHCFLVIIIYVNISITLLQYVLNPAQYKQQFKIVDYEIPQRKTWFKGW